MMDRTALIVEDDGDLRAVLAEVLADQGYSVDVASNGAEALRQLRGHVDVRWIVVLDMAMPVMDGYAFLDALRAEPIDVPVVIFSGSPIEALSPGMTVLRKPVALSTLLEAIDSAL